MSEGRYDPRVDAVAHVPDLPVAGDRFENVLEGRTYEVVKVEPTRVVLDTVDAVRNVKYVDAREWEEAPYSRE